MNTGKRRLFIKGICLALFVVLIFLLSRFGPQPIETLGPLWEELEHLEEFFSKREQLGKFLQSLGGYSSAVFMLLQAFQVVLSPVPGELTGWVGGYFYGKTYGFLFSTIGLTLGSWLAFELARILGRPFAEKFASKKFLDKFNFVTTNAGTTICFLLFTFPGFPKDYLCYVLGLSRMNLATFLVVSTIGRLPGTYLLTIQGASVRSQDYMAAAAFAIIAAVILFIAYLYRDNLFHWMKRERGAEE